MCPVWLIFSFFLCVHSQTFTDQMKPTPEEYFGLDPNTPAKDVGLKLVTPLDERGGMLLVYNVTASYKNPLQLNNESVVSEAKKEFLEIVLSAFNIEKQEKPLPIEILLTGELISFRSSVISSNTAIKEILPIFSDYNNGRENELRKHLNQALQKYNSRKERPNFKGMDVKFLGPLHFYHRYFFLVKIQMKLEPMMMDSLLASGKPHHQLLQNTVDEFWENMTKNYVKRLDQDVFIEHFVILRVHDTGAYSYRRIVIDALLYVDQSQRNIWERRQRMHLDWYNYMDMIKSNDGQIDVQTYVPIVSSRYVTLKFKTCMYLKIGFSQKTRIPYDDYPSFYNQLSRDIVLHIMKMAHIESAVTKLSEIDTAKVWFSFVYGDFNITIDIFKLRSVRPEYYLPEFGYILKEQLYRIPYSNKIPIFSEVVFDDW